MELWLLISVLIGYRGEQYFTNLSIGIEQVGILMLARKFGAKIQNGGKIWQTDISSPNSNFVEDTNMCKI